MSGNRVKKSIIILIVVMVISSCANVVTKANIKSECPNIETATSDLKSNGALILQSAGNTSLMNMVSMTKTQINKPKESPAEFSVSPNGRWIAYDDAELDENMNYLFHNLIVAGENNQIYKTLPWESEWGAFRWLDNESLIIRTIPQSEPNSVINYNTNFLVFNPFTGERQTVKVDYPNIYNSYPLPDWDGWGVTAYNQTLNRVVYLEGGVSGPFYYVLWDIQKKSQITNLQIIEDLDANPRWSPDGEQFAFAPSLFSKMKKYPSYELYSVTKDGNTKQLTNLADYYPWVYIAD